ncbi:MAG: polysaccharide deacetylase family protein [Rubrivivax sp.]
MKGCLAVASLAVPGWAGSSGTAAPCAKPVYLTFDTGHMGVAPQVAEVLARQGVKATFFLAQERTKSGGGSLDDEWAAWWRARADEGHAFGSHTWDHDVWVGDSDAGLRLRPTMGPQAGRVRVASPAQYCEALRRPAERFEAITGRPMAAIFRAPGGKTSPALLRAAEQCGFTHVGWTPAGFLGDELSSETHPNAALLARALRDIRPGDILLAHLGIWSRRDPWAPAVLEPLIEGLKARGMCFATLREHPTLGAAASRPVAVAGAPVTAAARPSAPPSR